MVAPSPYKKWKPQPKAVTYTNPYAKPTPAPQPTKTPTNLYNPVANQNKPGTSPAIDWLGANMPGFNNTPGYLRGRMANELWNADTAGGGYPTLPGSMPLGPGGSSGGGGGGGGAGATGLDQATLDWLFGQLGQGRPQQLTQTQLDLPDPSQFYKWDNSLYNQARQGVATGIEGIRGRGNTAFDRAGTELAQYQNPYGGGLQTQNPDLQAAMQRMMSANNVNPSSVATTNNEGVQADQAMRNTLAMLAGTDQARQAANQRALAGDRTTFEQNLGLEGNMLNLGVNMSEAKGKSAFDQMVQDAMLNAANQEAAQNWQRGNTVGDTNVTNRNAWNQGLMQTLLSIIGAKAPDTTLPTDTGGWYATA